MSVIALNKLPPMKGAKSGKSGGSSAGAKEAPNTLQSKTLIKLMEILGEGPINRLVGSQPGQAVIMNAGQATATPLMGPDGQWLYQGANVDVRLGEPSQEPMKGFDDQVTTVQIQVPVKNQGDPIGHAVVRRINDLDTSAVRVVMQVDSLINIDIKTGDQNGYSVEYSIDVKQRADQPGQQFVEKVHDRITGKTTGAWQQAYRIPLEGEGPWDIRVRRLSPDDTSTSKQSGTSWALLEQITEYKLGYPHTAYVGLTVDTSQFGTSIPVRGYLVEGLIVQVPSNYDAINRTYNGVWDGTFTSAYSNNPAWVLYDILSNNRYGLGDLFTPQRLSLGKWDLYQIAKYADGYLARPNGQTDDYGVNGKHGVPDGKGGFEPRFTFNATINTKEKAYECIAAICGMMRAAMLWAGGQARLMQDRPMKAVKIFSPANVIDGTFNYTGTALRARHTAVRVLWMNPDKGWDVDDVVIEDPDAIVRYGYNLKEETAYGCTSYGQALRHARNILVTERLETDSAQWRIGSGEIDMMPGQVCDIADPSMTQAEWAGRVAQHTLGSITFDRDIQFDPARTYTLTVVLADGSLKDVGITNPGAAARTVQLAAQFDAGNRPVPNAMYAISSDVLSMRSFRLVTIGTEGDGTYKMAAMQYAHGKFAEIESGLKEAPQIYSDLPATNKVQPPTGLVLNYSAVKTSTTTEGVLEVEWQASPDVYLAGYYVEYQYGFDDWVRLPLQKSTNVRLINPKLGPVRVRVTVINLGGLASGAITRDLDLSTGTANDKDLISALQVLGGGYTWKGRDLTFVWQARPTYGDGALQTDGRDPFFRSFRVQIRDAATNVALGVYDTTDTKFVLPYDQMVAIGLRRSYRVSIAIEDINGAFSQAYDAVFSNPAPSLLAPQITAKPNGVTLAFAASDDADYEGQIVWTSTEAGVIPSDLNKVWKNKGNPVIPVEPGQRLFLKYALYDAFGETGLNISSEVAIDVPLVEAQYLGEKTAAEIIDSITNLEDTYGNTENANAAKLAAEAARDVALGAAANSTAAKEQAQGALTAAQQAAQSSLDQATIATQAAGNADGARAAAVAAQTASEQAKDAALGAVTLANGAVTAAQSARDASQQAQAIADQRATDAAGAAGVATGQATIAIQKADAAGQSATIASAQSEIATTQAGYAETRASNAATSEQNALGYKNAAEQASSVTASTYKNTVLTGGNQFFNDGTTGWLSSSGTPVYNVSFLPTFNGRNNVLTLNQPNQTGVYSERLYDIYPDRKYRFRAGTYVGPGAGVSLNYFGFRCYDANGPIGANSGHEYWHGVPIAAGSGWVDLTTDAIGLSNGPFRPGTTRVQPLAILNYDQNGSLITAIDYLTIEDVTETQKAADSATASAQSASTASASKTAAGLSAEASETSRLAAETAKGDAKTFRDQAVQASQDASGSAQTASQQAGVATSARADTENLKTDTFNLKNQASGFADAASGSAQTASSRATAAEQSAVAANASANVAGTQAGYAQTSAQQAATSEQNALGSKNAAASSAIVSASNAVVAARTAASAFPSTFENEYQFFGDLQGDPADPTWGTDPRNWSFPIDGTWGKLLRITDPGQYQQLRTRALIPNTATPTRWRSEITYRVLVTPVQIDFVMGVYGLGSNYREIFYGGYITDVVTEGSNGAVMPGDSSWKTSAIEFTTNGNVCPWIAPTLYSYFPGGLVTGVVYEVREFKVTNVTESDKAKKSATASTQSASTAATAKQGAVESAAASEQSKIDAQTARGQAQGFRDQAAQSVIDANGAASTASQQAGIATSAKADAANLAQDAAREAGNAQASAQASASSAQTANSKAIEAGQYADAASGSAVNANTRAGDANASATAAAQSKADAQGFSNSASTSAATTATTYKNTVLLSGNFDFNDKLVGWDRYGYATNLYRFEPTWDGRTNVAVAKNKQQSPLYHERLYDIDVTRKYQFTIVTYVGGGGVGTGVSRTYAGFQCYDANDPIGANTGHEYWMNEELPVGIGWVSRTSRVYTGADFRPGTKQIGLLTLQNYDNNTTADTAVDLLMFEDVTSKVDAAASASAASISATNSKASETAAGQSAVASAGSEQTARTKAGEALASAGAAALSEQNALGYQNSAAASQQLAASTYLKTVDIAGNPNFDQGLDGWQLPTPASSYSIIGNAFGRNNVLASGEGVQGNAIIGRKWAINSADQRFRLSAGFAAGGAAGPQTFYAGAFYYDANEVLVAATDGTGNYPLSPGNTLDSAVNGWVDRSTVIGKGTVAPSPYGGTVVIPPAAVSFRPVVYLNYYGAAGRMYLDYFRVEDVTAEINAGGYATAANQSAQTAAASETVAGQKASAASESAQTAVTKAGEASASADRAVTSEANALSYRNTASQQATLAATSADSAATAASAAYPDEFSQDGRFFSDLQGDPKSPVAAANWSFPNDSTWGKLLRITNPGQYQQLRTRNVIPNNVAGRWWRIETQARVLSFNGAPISFVLNAYGLGADFSFIYYNGQVTDQVPAMGTEGSATIQVGDTAWRAMAIEFKTSGNTCPWIAPTSYMYSANAMNGVVIEYRYYRVTDVTSEKLAAGSASAASTSASQASTLKDQAGNSATAANQSRIDAQAANSAAQGAASLSDQKSVVATNAASAALSAQTLSSAFAATQGVTPNGLFEVDALWNPTAAMTYGTWYKGKGYRALAGTNGNIGSNKFKIDPTRKYRFTAGFVHHGDGTVTGKFYFGVTCFDVNGQNLGNVYTLSSQQRYLNGSVYYLNSDTYSGTQAYGAAHVHGDAFHAGTDSVSVIAYLNYPEPTPTNFQTEIYALYMEDMTQEKNAATQASIAQTAATQASNSAAAAQTSAVLSASTSGGMMNKNAVFADFPPQSTALSPPSCWVGWTAGTYGYQRQDGLNSGIPVEGSPWSFSQVNQAGQEAGVYQEIAAAGGTYNFVATVQLQDGNWKGSGLLALGINSSGQLVNQQFIDFERTPDANGQTAGQLSYSYGIRRFNYPLKIEGGASVVRIVLYAMTSWAGIDPAPAYKQLRWFRAGLVPSSNGEAAVAGIASRVSTVESVAADAASKVATAYSVKEVVAGGATAFMSFRAKDDNGNFTSDVGIGASTISLFNQSGGVFKLALQVVGGNVVLMGGLQAGAFIRLGSGQGWPVALAQCDFTVADETYIDFGVNLVNVPDFTFARNNFAPLGTGQTYQVYIDNPTPTGGTLKAKIITPGSPSNVNLTSDYAGGGPTRIIDKGSNADSTDGTYALQITGTVTGYGYFVNDECVWVEAFLHSGQRAGDAKVGDEVLILNGEDEVFPGEVASIRFGDQRCVRLTTVSGVTLTCSTSTPVDWRDGTKGLVTDALGREMAVMDNGEFRWEKVVLVEDRGMLPVALIYARDVTYAAGDQKGRQIFTHNINDYYEVKQ